MRIGFVMVDRVGTQTRRLRNRTAHVHWGSVRSYWRH